MKRPPGIWFLLSAGVLWLSLQDAHGIRASSLIFSKSSTTTSTTETPTNSSSSEENSTTEISTDQNGSNTTKPTLTGIPQIDYIWDPNLPKELNGYNLSSYPFYERVPEEIDFKCDGLHDGFYASVPHKCQVYHHCLFGTRYDFLCANYTAFDQKTFICHFVSEVDCVNSKKYWHRNDALYQAASTTTVKPPPQFIYTPPQQPSSVLQPTNNNQPQQPLAQPAAEAPLPKTRPFRRGPNRRRPPQYDYYDDYDDYEYEERPRSRRKRPRPRPRPIYEDEYEEYEDERYERRPLRRRPAERRRNKDRRKYEDEDYVLDEEERDRRHNNNNNNKRRPIAEDRRRIKPKRPVEEDYEEDDLPPAEPPVTEKQAASKPAGGSIYDRPRAPPRIKPPVPKNEADKYAYKPVHTASVKEPATSAAAATDEDYYEDYEEVPKRKQETTESRRYTKPPRREENIRKPLRSRPVQDEEEDDIRTTTRQKSNSKEEEPVRNVNRQRHKEPEQDESRINRPKKEHIEDTKPVEEKEEEEIVVRNSNRPPKDEPVEELEVRTPSRPKFVPKNARPKKQQPPPPPSTTTPPPPPSEEYYDDYEEIPEEINIQKSQDKVSTTTSTTSKPQTSTKESQREIVRIVKRPFLPSRGGNPYSARGLQPVGAKALDRKPEPIPIDEPFKPSPAIIKVPIRAKVTPNSEPEQHHDERIQNSKQVDVIEEPKTRSRPLTVPKIKPDDYTSLPRTTQKPKIINNNNNHQGSVDLVDEYDVTLNDALNPTLPNLPVRAFPTGFSAANDYTYSSFQRPRIIIDPGLVPASSDFVYQLAKPNSNKGQSYNTISRPRLSQIHLQNYYSNF